jgi:hypothetical protein
LSRIIFLNIFSQTISISIDFFPGNVMILEECKIQGKAKVPVTASLCGIPRIKPLVHMEIWSNEQLKTDKFCQVLVDDRRLIRGNRIMLNIINTGDEEVVLPARTLVAFVKVSMTSPSVVELESVELIQ